MQKHTKKTLNLRASTLRPLQLASIGGGMGTSSYMTGAPPPLPPPPPGEPSTMDKWPDPRP